MGDRLGLYRALAGAGPLTPAELAQRTGTTERYIREWLNAQAAGAYVNYDPDSGRLHPATEHAAVLADESSPAYLPGLFQTALGSAFRVSAGAAGFVSRPRLGLCGPGRGCALGDVQTRGPDGPGLPACPALGDPGG